MNTIITLLCFFTLSFSSLFFLSLSLAIYKHVCVLFYQSIDSRVSLSVMVFSERLFNLDKETLLRVLKVMFGSGSKSLDPKGSSLGTFNFLRPGPGLARIFSDFHRIESENILKYSFFD
jgi:hypothetical protein